MTSLNAAASPVLPLVYERSAGYWETVGRRFLRDKVAVGAALVVLFLMVLAVFGPWLAPMDPYQSAMLKRLKPIGFEGHPLGTDELGRDMLTRLMVGAKLSLFMGITPVVCAFFIGSLIGITAGYTGGWVNSVMMRTIDVFYPFGVVGHCPVGRFGGRHHQFPHLLDDCVHTAAGPCGRKRDHADSGA
jgi:peptide/nickel transport system permease protein